VHLGHQLEGSKWSFDHGDGVAKISSVQGSIYCLEAPGTFWMHLTGGVLDAPVIRNKQHVFNCRPWGRRRVPNWRRGTTGATSAGNTVVMGIRTMVYSGRDRVQVGPWKASGTVANLIPFPAREKLPVEVVYKTIDEARDLGFTSGYTAALNPSQAKSFFDAGFTLHEELHLLRRELTQEITVTRGATRRARKADWDQILYLDGLAFQEFWQFDRIALADAVRATPRHRFQVIKSEPVHGYHVTGLAGINSYIQRVAVHPDAQRMGYGSALVNDSLRWAWRNGASLAQVNTQITNERAVALYERCGFTFAPHRLVVLHHDFSRGRNDAPEPPLYS